MKHPKTVLFLSLCALLVGGALIGITTPQQVQARQSLRDAELSGDALFHSSRLGTNGLSCDTCHVDGGRFSHQLGDRRIPGLVGAKTLFPEAQANGQVRTLEAQINLCITHALKGRPLPANSRKLALLDLYIRHLSRFHER
ncbi:c-type cytochrome [Sulfobacillus harzensis]|uniref:Cytochrome c domain-containing protein n=1 Tax=Sulfobacillus harzensis TaxID=2729629 RepID=A0A7Y0L6C4_9FIRM|nr:hypothetical protein [Sulfobacillus harzensis]NMP23752.1 hypothetical protein [Sulfobacillus harzensis]